jgi:phage shock protein E
LSKKNSSGFLNFLGLGSKSSTIEESAKNGAIIIDVRNHDESISGHVIASKNIPIQILQHEVAKIKSCNKPIIACCQSGVRSSQATSLLTKNNIDCFNGGGCCSLNSKRSAM